MSEVTSNSSIIKDIILIWLTKTFLLQMVEEEYLISYGGIKLDIDLPKPIVLQNLYLAPCLLFGSKWYA